MRLTKKSVHKLTQSSSVEDNAEEADGHYDEDINSDSSCSIGNIDRKH